MLSRLYDVLDEITQAAAAEKARYSRLAAAPRTAPSAGLEKRKKDKHKPPVSYPGQPAAARWWSGWIRPPAADSF